MTTDTKAPAGSGETIGTSLSALHAANKARQTEWCIGGDPEPDLAFRGNELAGEVGEACNAIKKLERERHGWRGSRTTKEALAEELADVVICADLCAITAGIDLDAAVVAKFNTTSAKVGLTTTLAAPRPPQPETPSPVGRDLAALAEVPSAGTEERELWIEAALQHGMYEKHGRGCVVGLYGLVDAVLELMAGSRKQGHQDALTHLRETPASPPAAAGGVDREAELDRQLDEVMRERDEHSSALLRASEEMDGPEWGWYSESRAPGETGDLNVDVPVLAAEWVARATRAERALATATTPPAAEQEAIARIIDPETWARLDRYAEERFKLGDTPDQARSAADSQCAFYTAPSLKRAQATLARIRCAALPAVKRAEVIETGDFEASLRGPGAWTFERHEHDFISDRTHWVRHIQCNRPFMPDENVRNLRPLYFSKGDGVGLFAAPRQTETQAAHDVLAERRRQVEDEGWSPEHDDGHDGAEMARAAGFYAMRAPMGEDGDPRPPRTWPWAARHWKLAPTRRMLVKAGALIIAEIERLDRAKATPHQPAAALGGDDEVRS